MHSGLATAFPKSAGAFGLGICHASNHYRRATHEPRNAGQSNSQFGQNFRVGQQIIEIRFSRPRRGTFFVSPLRKQVLPSASNLIVRPFFHHIRPTSQDDMRVIRHHRESDNVDAENSCEELQSIPHPLPPIIDLQRLECLCRTKLPAELSATRGRLRREIRDLKQNEYACLRSRMRPNVLKTSRLHPVEVSLPMHWRSRWCQESGRLATESAH